MFSIIIIYYNPDTSKNVMEKKTRSISSHPPYHYIPINTCFRCSLNLKPHAHTYAHIRLWFIGTDRTSYFHLAGLLVKSLIIVSKTAVKLTPSNEIKVSFTVNENFCDQLKFREMKWKIFLTYEMNYEMSAIDI